MALPRTPCGFTCTAAASSRTAAWADGAKLRINGRDPGVEARPQSYANLERHWSAGDTIQLDLPMKVSLIQAHPLVEETRNHVAVLRGPIVYCLESADLPESARLDDVRLPRRASWHVRYDADLLRGVTVLETEGTLVPGSPSAPALYGRLPDGPPQPIPLRLIPYYARSNRGQADVTVWIPLQ